MKNRRAHGIFLPLFFWFTVSAAAQTEPKALPPVTFSVLNSDTQVAVDGSYTQTVHAEIRAGNDAAASQVGQVNLPYDATTQDISVVDAHTQKADGRSVKVDASAIYDQAPSGQQILVTGQRAKLIVFPQFAAGDTAIYTVKISTQHPSFPNQFTTGELFPRSIPYDAVHETITVPKSLPLFVESHEVEFMKQEDAANITYSWRYSAPQPVENETATLSPMDHTPRFFASSFRDYAEMGRAYAALTEPKRVVTPAIAALAGQITSGVSDPKTQAQRLYEWVSSHIRYVGIELGSGSFIPHDADLIVANGYGDCKDHDLLLQVLLKAKGIESQSVVLNSGDGYTVTEVPTFTVFDHVITYLPQFNLYLDSTAQVAPFGILPLQQYGKPMVVASLTAPRFGKMPLLPPGLAKTSLKSVVTLDKDGNLSGTSTTTASGPYAITLRGLGMAIQAAGPTAAKSLLTAFGFENPSGSFSQESPAGFAPDFTISGTFKASGWTDEASGKNSFFMPPGMRLLGRSGDGVMGPFEARNMKPDEPTPCFSAEQTEDLSLTAPSGEHFSEVPKDLRVETPNLVYVSHWSLAGDTLSVHRDFTSKIDQSLCSGDVRIRTAAALKQIADSYNVNVSFVQPESAQSKAIAALYTSASAHFQAGSYDLTIADLDKAIALDPDNGRAYYNRGLAQQRLRKYDLAVADFDKAIARMPDDARLYYSRGSAKNTAHQYTEAIADFDKSLALNPSDADVILARGIAYSNARQSAPAIADFDKFLALHPEAVEILGLRAQVHMQMGDYALAIADYDELIAKRPNSASAFFFRGDAKTKIGKKEEGASDMAMAAKLDPSFGRLNGTFRVDIQTPSP